MADCGEKTNASILRTTDDKTMELINLYQLEECLWNTTHPHYRDTKMRRFSAEKIATLLDIPHFGPRHVIKKFKNLRNAYSQELKKIAKSQMIGGSYAPSVFWFNKMDSFIKPHLQKPIGSRVPSVVYHVDGTEEWLHVDESKSTDNIAIEVTSESDSCDSQSRKRKSQMNSPSSMSLKIAKMNPVDVDSDEHNTIEISGPPIVRNVTKESSRRVDPTIKKYIDDQQQTVASAIKDLSNTLRTVASTRRNDDCFDSFGKYVATLLRTLPHNRALEVQPQIISFITEAGLEEDMYAQNNDNVTINN